MTFARGEAAPLASPWSAEAEFVFMLAGPAGLADAEVPERPLDWRWVVALAERERATHILRDYLQRVASPW
ncbi:MAG TPA: hypothetical protein VEA99_07745, partial [Gemmatimonadaceae bacterium]|nr:hypothetical protein [Gemmatimonadaceae bacterium]